MDRMPRLSNRLTALTLRSLPSGKHPDGAGLYLIKPDAVTGRWILRYRQFGRRRDMGLGGWPRVGLGDARRAAEAARRLVDDGLDPISSRRLKTKASQHLLRNIAKDCFDARKAELRGEGVAGRWYSPIEVHLLPKLGSTPVVSLNQVMIKDALAQLWKEKPVTAQRALERLGIILRYAAAMGLEVDLQATAKARLLLGKPRHQVQHIPAMAWSDVPNFYSSLVDLSSTHLALRFLILSGMRSAPVRHAALQQIDLNTKVWTVPADLMKGLAGHTEDFRVPLSSEAVRVIDLATSSVSRDGLLFPGEANVIGDMTLSRHMLRRGLAARPHGFRTSLRVWLAEQTDASREVAETILAHTVGGKVERAYRRTDFLEQRRRYLESWGEFVSGLARDTNDVRNAA